MVGRVVVFAALVWCVVAVPDRVKPRRPTPPGANKEPKASRECQRGLDTICGLGDPREVMSPYKKPPSKEEVAKMSKEERMKARKPQPRGKEALVAIEQLGTCVTNKMDQVKAICDEDLIQTLLSLVAVRTHTSSATEQGCQDFVKDRCPGLTSHLEDLNDKSREELKAVGLAEDARTHVEKMVDYDCVMEHAEAMAEHCGHANVACYFAHVSLCPLNLFQQRKKEFRSCLAEFKPQFDPVCPKLDKPDGPLWHKNLHKEL